MASIFTRCRTALQTASQSVAPFSSAPSQVVLGNFNLAANTNFFGNLATTGPWLFIEPSSGASSGYDFNGEFKCEVALYYANANPNQNYDFTTIEDIMGLLMNAWSTYSEFVLAGAPATGNIGPFEIEWANPYPRTDIGPNAFETRFTFTFKMVTNQAG